MTTVFDLLVRLSGPLVRLTDYLIVRTSDGSIEEVSEVSGCVYEGQSTVMIDTEKDNHDGS